MWQREVARQKVKPQLRYKIWKNMSTDIVKMGELKYRAITKDLY